MFWQRAGRFSALQGPPRARPEGAAIHRFRVRDMILRMQKYAHWANAYPRTVGGGGGMPDRGDGVRELEFD